VGCVQHELIQRSRWILDGDLRPYDTALEVRLRAADTIAVPASQPPAPGWTPRHGRGCRVAGVEAWSSRHHRPRQEPSERATGTYVRRQRATQHRRAPGSASAMPENRETTGTPCGRMPDVDVAFRLNACMRRWQLCDERPLDSGFASDVFACTTATGKEVVVKLPATERETRAEVAALSAWEHTRAAVRLIDTDLVQDALLLERIQPGTHLPGNDDHAATEIAADLLTRLHQAPAGSFPFPDLQEYYMRAEQRARDDASYEQRVSGDSTLGEAGLARLGDARLAVERLCASAKQTVLLHGDFLDKNLLSSGTSYLAIDPIPCIGDPCSDVGFFAAGHPPATGILHRADAIAALMSLDRHRARRWAAIWAVLQTCQAWRDDQPALEACMSASEFEELLNGQ
jgi:streptomycin 6-kinase